ncbi:hypothetical protein RBH29_17135 [Herbivorax sp. ANBcel31]|uniref:hypothetical protein n=1 Tax=Herbivorax sp. ANBcel31 TaxID=3069754 RepID=UPI0027B2F0DA|nr:hypothetical protein [Herbivorax sp. ANBcel31]MDQ2088152.1 hypothetical protein [Herbivorax sp. ANBcel31]
MDDNIIKNLIFIIEDLRFEKISERETNIAFIKDFQNKGFEQGIMYLKEDSHPVNLPKVEKIKYNWYYYETRSIVGL